MQRTREDSTVQLFENQDELVTYHQLAQLLHVSVRTLRRYVAVDDIPYHRVGDRAIRFSKTEVTHWLQKKRSKRR